METFQKKLEDLLDSEDAVEISLCPLVFGDGVVVSCTYKKVTEDSSIFYYLPTEQLSFNEALAFIIAYIDEKKNGP